MDGAGGQLGRQLYVLTMNGVRRGISALTSPSVRSEVDSRVLDTRGRSPRPSDRLAPARGIILSAITGLLLWIALIVVGYLLVERAGL